MLFPRWDAYEQTLRTAAGMLIFLAGPECRMGAQDPDLLPAWLLSLQSASPSPPESVVEEERPGGLGGNGKQQAEEKDLSGPYVSGGRMG